MTESHPVLADSALSRLAHDRLLSAMRLVESLPPSARGAFLVGPHEEPLGTILIEANRLCWGAASGMSGRLRDILRSHCHGSVRDGELDAIYDRCRRESQPLEHALVVSGLFTPDHMRAALKQHTIESLLALDAAVIAVCGSQARQWPMQWIDHVGRGYNPRYTFGAVEVMAGVGAERLAETDAVHMTEHLEGLADDGSALVAFSFQPDGTPLYVGAQTQVPLNLQDLIDLTSWADAALGASPGFSPAAARACVQSADGGTVAWRYRGQRCAAVCVEHESLSRLSASLLERSLPIVLATRASVLDRVRGRVRRIRQGE